MKINIALKIKDTDITNLVEFAESISQDFETIFHINSTDRIPHITLFQGEFLNLESSELSTQIGQLVENYSGFTLYGLRLIGEYLSPESIWYQFANRIELIALHFELLNLVSEFNINIEEKFKEGSEFLNLLNINQNEQLKRFGNPYVGYVYDPHITLCRLKKIDDVPQVLKNIRPVDWQIQIEGISIFESGDHGTCKNLISEFLFKPYNLK